MAVDYEELATRGMSADQLAVIFLKEHFGDKEISYPINPFQILTDLGIPFILRPFNKYEGIYIPAVNEDDFPIVGINLKRPIVRQRFTAAHELCHHLKHYIYSMTIMRTTLLKMLLKLRCEIM